MPQRITGRGVEITKPIKELIEKKLTRLDRYTDKVQSLEVIVDKDSYNHRVELNMKAGQIAVNASVKDPDVRKAIELLIDKVERQLSKKTKRMKEKKGTSVKRIATPALEEIPALSYEPATNGTAVATKTMKRARKSARVQPLLAENVGVYIFQKGEQLCKRMDIYEAAEELFFNDENFLCFQNADTRGLNVLYRRQDGNFGVIELEAEK